MNAEAMATGAGIFGLWRRSNEELSDSREKNDYRDIGRSGDRVVRRLFVLSIRIGSKSAEYGSVAKRIVPLF